MASELARPRSKWKEAILPVLDDVFWYGIMIIVGIIALPDLMLALLIDFIERKVEAKKKRPH